MTTTMIENKRSGERGNVLFLILIAVALFAALSYAVTQSTRSGSGDASSETNLISSAQLTQYPAGIRTAIVRMIIAGTPVNDLLFNVPSDFDSIPSGDEKFAVFHPLGGGSIYTNASQDMLASGQSGQWYYNAALQIADVGLTDAGGGAGNDLIAFLPGVSQNVCRKINEELGIGNVTPTGPAYTPTGAVEGASTDYMNEAYTFPSADATLTIGEDGDTVLAGQPFGCYVNGGTYVYYHVLVER